MPRVIRQIEPMRQFSREARRHGRSVGLVPTMGALHEGHLSLVDRSVAANDLTVVSIFVNPLQFGPAEDLDRYPRDLEGDCRLLEARSADVVFTSEVARLYPEGFATYVTQESLTGVLCGRSRPGHFRGVTTICAKLFHIIEPDRVYFGQKDYQQALVIRRMLRDLDFGIHLEIGPIIRDADGLALSSRNRYLSPADRHRALALSRALRLAREAVAGGERQVARLERLLHGHLEETGGIEIDYAEILDAETLQRVETLTEAHGGRVVAALAARVGGVRLIDNEILTVGDVVGR